MPSHKIHIAIAQQVNKRLKLNNDEISLGSVLPDLVNVENHGISHFQYIDKYPQNLANPDEFIKLYKEYINNTISIGYLIHLLTDRFYNEKYYRKFYLFDNNVPTKLFLNNKIITDKKIGKEMKNHDFEEYDKYLISHNMIIPFKDKKVISKIPKYKNIPFDEKFLSEYIDKNNEELKKDKANYEFLYWSKKELDNIFNECILYTINYIKNNIDKEF